MSAHRGGVEAWAIHPTRATARRSGALTLVPLPGQLLDRARAALLEDLPVWEWEPAETDWEAALARLVAFAPEHGHAQVAEAYRSPDGFYLGAWVRRAAR